MRKIVLIIHTSIDGFVADENGRLNHLVQSPENLDFVCGLTESADAVLAGRISFEALDSYWPDVYKNPNASVSEVRYSNWYNGAEKIVLSRALSQNEKSGITVLSEDIETNLLHLKNKKGKDILLFGSPSVYRELAKSNLIDEYWIIMYPVLLGKGVPLFNGSESVRKMHLLGSSNLSKGEIAVNYKVELSNRL